MTEQEVFLSRFLRCEADLRAFVGAVVRDVHLREDVFQEIALTLWQQFGLYDPDRPFGAWARGVAAKKLLERSSGNRRLPLVLSPEAILKRDPGPRQRHGPSPGIARRRRSVPRAPSGRPALSRRDV